MAYYAPEQVEKALQTLPEELQDAFWSMETAEHIWNVREKYGLLTEKADTLPAHVGYVLSGLMTPQEFQEALQKEMKIPKKTAEQVAREINRFVFYPVKPALEQLHRMEVGGEAKAGARKKERPQGEREEEERMEEGAQQAPGEEERGGPDQYREPIE